MGTPATKEVILESGDVYKLDPYIHTQDGRFYISDPVWKTHAIAHALSQNARFNGNTNKFYSVAEHSVLVSLLMEDLDLGDPREGLYHDGTESVMSDVPAPLKHLLPDWQVLDNKLETSLRKQFNLPETKTSGCKTADWLALFIEADAILPGRGADFWDPEGLRPEALKLMEKGWHINNYSWRRAKQLFLDRDEQLRPR